MPEAEKKINLKEVLKPSGLAGLWSMMSGFRVIYLGAVLSLAAAAIARTGTLLLLKFIVDKVLNQGFYSNLLYLFALVFVGLAVIEGSASFFRGKLASRSSEGITMRLRNFLLDHIQRLSFSYHDHAGTGDLIARVTSDVDTLRRFYAEQATEIGRVVTLFIFNLLAVINLNSVLGLFSIIFMPFIILQSIWFFKRISAAYGRYQEQESRLSSTLQENISAIRIVRGFARQAFEKEKFEKENWEKFQRGRHLLKLHSLYWPTSNILCTMQMLLIFFLGAKMAIAGTISLGTYIAVSGMIIWIIWPMRNLGRIIVQASSALVSYKRIIHIINDEPEKFEQVPDEISLDIRGELVFDNVCFEYKEGEGVLHNVSINCHPGQVVALLGKAGSGKTTLVNLLPRFYEYTSGSLKLDGRELNQYPLHILRRQIGIVEQESFLFSRTIKENIIFGTERKVSPEEIEEAARAAAIHDVILSFPKGYDTLVGEKGVTLSGGQKQRLAIARTILKDPKILILDDATSSIDSETENLIQNSLSHLMEGRTSFVIAHRIQTVMRADIILILDQGNIVQQGTHEELIREQGFYKQIFDLQSGIAEEKKGSINA